MSTDAKAVVPLGHVVIRFAGDSGDGMQLTGDRFTSERAGLGNDLSTLPDFPAEIRAPAGTLTTSVDRDHPRLDSLTSLLPAASWHERELREMFGVDFDGHPELRPLLLSPGLGIHPLRKESVLVTRAVTPWPGAPESSGQDEESSSSGRRSRRASQPPGVPADWLREEGS